MKLLLKNPNTCCRIWMLAAAAVLFTVVLCSNSIAQTGSEPEPKPAPLSALQTRLDELLAQYTEFHPEVVRLRQQIRLLEENGKVAPITQAQTIAPATEKPAGPKAIQPPINLRGSSDTFAEPVGPSPTSNTESVLKPAIVPPPASAQVTPTGGTETPSKQPLFAPVAAPASNATTSHEEPLRATSSAVVASTSNAAGGTSQSEPLELINSPNVSSKKGPVFSPLPADLTPGSPVATKNVSAPPREANASIDTLDEKHLLAIGDRLSFRIVEDEEEPRALTIMDSGELEVPYIGRFYAVGHSCKDLAKALKKELEKDYYYKATVIVAVDLMARSRGKVYLSGAVRLPGAQEIPSDETFTLSKAILCAGGFADFADKKKVKITRKAADGVNEDHITVDVTEVLERGRTSADVALLSGDQVYVPERLIRF